MKETQNKKNLDVIKNDVSKAEKEKAPQADWYDYKLQPWDRSEWSSAWCEFSYKPWIYGDRKK